MSASTFPALLDQQLRESASRPLVTFYDDATGERVELSVATYANWVAKTASLLQNELDIEPGARVLVDLPTHWLGPVWLGALWHVGAVAVQPGVLQAGEADLVVCGPEGVEQYAGSGPEVIACSLLPMGVRFRDPLPTGVIDFGVVVWGQPDAFLALDPPTPDQEAWQDEDGSVPQSDLTALAIDPTFSVSGARIITDQRPTTRLGIAAFVGPLTAGGGTVWVRNAAQDAWAARSEAEQATVVRAQPRS